MLILDGLQFKIGGKWLNGHISLAPLTEKEQMNNPGGCESAHVTIVGGHNNEAHYFFEVGRNGWKTSGVPKRFQAKNKANAAKQHNGSDLGGECAHDVTIFLNGVFGYI